MEKPSLLVWAGTATYKLFGGLLRFRLPEGGVLKLDKTKSETKEVYDHTYRELVYFKK